jgi:hypothetical protein
MIEGGVSNVFSQTLISLRAREGEKCRFPLFSTIISIFLKQATLSLLV